MSRSRAYTRKELESLRRADLQNLYKVSHPFWLSLSAETTSLTIPQIHGLRGANQRTEALITGLGEHFATLAPPVSSTRAAARQLKPIGEQRVAVGVRPVPVPKPTRLQRNDTGESAKTPGG